MSSIFYDQPSRQAERRHERLSVAIIVLVIAAVALVLMRLQSKGQLDPEVWKVLVDPDLGVLLMQGLVATVRAAATAFLLSLSGGAFLAFILLSSSRAALLLARGWVGFFRGLPVLLLVFCVFLGGPAIGLNVSTFWALVIGLAVFNSAVFAEIFRSGVESLPRGQREAGYAIGLGEVETLRLVLVPQAIRRMLPVLVSQSVVLLKETSFGFIIGYSELLREGRSAVEFLGGQYSLPVYCLLAVVYISMNICLSSFARWLHKRYG